MSGRFLPWSDSCYVCGEANPLGLGVRFTVAGDQVRTTTVLDPRYEGYPGHVHGGVVTALLDETVGWACTARCGRLFLTVELTVRFLKPVPAGRAITVVGRCDGEPNRIARGEGWIEDESGEILARASGTFFPLPPERNREVAAQLKMPGRTARVDDLTGGAGDSTA